MNIRYKRFLCTLLAALLLCGACVLVGCADSTEEQDEDKLPEQEQTDGEAEDQPKEEIRLPIDYLPEETYDGTEIHVLEWTVNDNPVLRVPWEEIDVDLQSGVVLEDAIFDRNATVEERFDVVITKEYVDINGNPPYNTVFRSNEQTGDQAFQMITLITARIAPYCLEGMMVNMFELENLHTDMPWWNQDSVRSFTMGDALYFAAPEMLLRDKGATATVFFNKGIAENYKITDLYELVEEGSWTWEEMLSMCETVTGDLDGDDMVSSSEDMFGFTGGTRDIPYFLFTASGQKFATIDEDGYLEMTFGTDESYITAWQDILDDFMFSEYYFGNTVDYALIPNGFEPFQADKSLFMMDLVRLVVILRNMKTDYGLLPVPKYDEYQEDYASLVWMHHDSVLGIPGSVINTDAVSAVLEYMSYLSYYDVYPIFYDTVLTGRSTRDEQSVSMLEIIFRTRTFDPGHYWLELELHSSNSFLTVFENQTHNIASLWASLEGAAEKKVEEYNETIDDLMY